MMQRWSPETVAFMADAADYGQYYRELAKSLLPYLPLEGHVCDAGCGIGSLALELSKHCREVTAVDLSAAALEQARKLPVPNNLRLIHGDIMELPHIYDAMVFCYFGKAHDILRLASTSCQGNIVVVRRDCRQHRFSAGPVERKPHSMDLLTQELRRLGIEYDHRPLSLELGQPFRSFEDAVAFFTLYNKSTVAVDPERIRRELISLQHPIFKLYYPCVRDMEVIVFSSINVKKALKSP